MLLWAGGGATAASLALRLMGKNKAATIVGACGTSLLLARMVAKFFEKRPTQDLADSEQPATPEHSEHPSVSHALTA
jgi:membrane protein implicated in regulation of membrane protease activity